MTQLIFKITKEQAKDNTFGNSDVIKLCELLGFKILDEVITWGDVKAEYRGHKFDVCKNRRLNEIRLFIDCGYSSQEKIKDLTEKKLKNLKTRIDDMVNEREKNNKERDRRQSVSSLLYKKGIIVHHKDFIIGEFSFSIKDDKEFYCWRQFSKYRSTPTVNSYIDELEEEFKRYSAEFLQFKAEYEKALSIANENKDLILSYYSKE